MGALVPIVLYGYLPFVILLFALLPARRAVVVAYLVGWLFLPLISYKFIPGLPAYNKVSAAAIGCMAGALIFHSSDLLRIRWSWLDIPVTVYCLAPIATNVLNGAGLYEGMAISLQEVFLWGVPWILGRAFFSDLEGARELALGIVIGGLLYVPLCLIEIKMSPQLNQWVYGFYQHAFNQTKRMGGWRPMVFMQHGLAVGLWMTSAALVAWWMWRGKVLPRLAGVSAGAWVGLILITAVLCKSTLAMVLLLVGISLLWISQRTATRWLLVALILAAPVYMFLRSTEKWGGDWVMRPVVTAVDIVFGSDRSSSLATRLRNEQLIVNKAMENPVFGWGNGGRYLVKDPDDPERILSVPDQFWVINLGRGGVVALGSLTGLLLLPALMFVLTCPARDLARGEVATVAALAMVPVLFMLDCLMNAMMNPVFTLASASVAGVTLAARRIARTGSPVPAGPVALSGPAFA